MHLKAITFKKTKQNKTEQHVKSSHEVKFLAVLSQEWALCVLAFTDSLHKNKTQKKMLS